MFDVLFKIIGGLILLSIILGVMSGFSGATPIWVILAFVCGVALTVYFQRTRQRR